jgi:hypothetical protein
LGGFFVKRFLSVFLLMGGLVVAGVANANVVATPTVDCLSVGSLSVTTATGIVGDTIVVSNIGTSTCATSIADAAVVTTTAGNSIPFQGRRTFTLAGAGTTTIQFSNLASTIGAGTITVTVTSPAPPTPSITSITPVTQGLRVAFDTGTVASASSSVTIASVNYTAACTSTNGGVSGSTAGPASPITVNNLTGGKSYTCTVSASDTGGTSTSAASAAAIPLAPPTPQAIPTLSEWTQIVMMLAMIATAGFYGWRMKQR